MADPVRLKMALPVAPVWVMVVLAATKVLVVALQTRARARWALLVVMEMVARVLPHRLRLPLGLVRVLAKVVRVVVPAVAAVVAMAVAVAAATRVPSMAAAAVPAAARVETAISRPVMAVVWVNRVATALSSSPGP